jgi:hypothetical protein
MPACPSWRQEAPRIFFLAHEIPRTLAIISNWIVKLVRKRFVGSNPRKHDLENCNCVSIQRGQNARLPRAQS